MADPIISPDGEWMWTGSDWIPAPPENAPDTLKSEDMQSDLTKSRELILPTPEYRQELGVGGVVIGGILLFISLNTLYSPNPILFGGDEFVILTTQGQICLSTVGIIGLLILVVGIQGNKVAENPKQAIIYELHKGKISYVKLQEKVGIRDYQFRKILQEMGNEGTIEMHHDSNVGRRYSLK